MSTLSNLEYLYIDRTKIETIDLTKNDKLIGLYTNSSGLKSIDLSANLDLEELQISNNKLNTINVSTNKKLEILMCNGNNIENLNVSNNPLLNVLWFHNNPVAYVNIKNSSTLDGLDLRHFDEELGRASDHMVGLKMENTPFIKKICLDNEDIKLIKNALGKDSEVNLDSNCNSKI